MTNAEIQVGEFVRTVDGKIGKLAYKTDYNFALDNKYVFQYRDEISDFKLIANHSFNLIDIIEVGDYVKIYAKLGNKEYIDNISSYVCNVGKSDGKSFIEIDYGQDGTGFLYNADRIKSIVTKEQFKSIEYRVGGEDG